MREWYLGETKAQAQAALESIQQEQMSSMQMMLPTLGTGNDPTTGE